MSHPRCNIICEFQAILATNGQAFHISMVSYQDHLLQSSSPSPSIKKNIPKRYNSTDQVLDLFSKNHQFKSHKSQSH